MWSIVPREGAWGATLTAWGAAASTMTVAKHDECYFLLSPVLVKVKILFGFLSIRENRY